MPLHASIRQARNTDCREIARLTNQLGYPATEGEIRRRLIQLSTSSRDVVFVAEISEGLAGWIHGVLFQFLESEFQVEIGGLVIDAHHHRQGIGRALIQRIENWGKSNGVSCATVRCNITRREAHQFYQSVGYSAVKTQTTFRKKI